MRKNDEFKSMHPVLNFVFFIFALGFSMFLQNPYFIIAGFLSALLYNIYIFSFDAFLKKLGIVTFTFILVLVINPLFNHRGVSIIFYLPNKNPVTLESLVFAFFSALMLLDAMLWFFIHNQIMTSDKIIYIAGRIFPSSSLIFSMALRFVPRYIKKAGDINMYRKFVLGGKKENFREKIKRSSTVFSVLTSLALEESITTSDSMKSRGYGLKNRTSYSNYRWSKKERNIFFYFLICIIFLIISVFRQVMYFQYYPYIKMGRADFEFYFTLFVYMAFLNSPLIINIVEDIKWQILRSKI